MSEVKRYTESCMEGGGVVESKDGELVDYSVYAAAQSELAALREELDEMTDNFNVAVRQKLELSKRLTAAEQWNAELQGLLTVWMFGYETGTLGPGHSNIYARTMTAIKPTESGASE